MSQKYNGGRGSGTVEVNKLSVQSRLNRFGRNFAAFVFDFDETLPHTNGAELVPSDDANRNRDENDAKYQPAKTVGDVAHESGARHFGPGDHCYRVRVYFLLLYSEYTRSDAAQSQGESEGDSVARRKPAHVRCKGCTAGRAARASF